MANFIKEEIVDQIKSRADLVDTIKSFVTLKPSGASLKGCCPFHDEKSGSFIVTPAKNIYKCFGCGKSGKSAITFLMTDRIGHQAMTYPEALKWLADRNGIDINS